MSNLKYPNWSEPYPLGESMPPAPNFDPKALLIEPLLTWSIDVAHRMCCPPDFIAATIIVVIGSIIGCRCVIQPKQCDDWIVVPNLWGMIVADVSSRKTPAITAALAPLRTLEEEAYGSHAQTLEKNCNLKKNKKKYKKCLQEVLEKAKKEPLPDLATVNRLEADLAAIEEKEDPSTPKIRRFATNDCTVPKLGELLRDNGGNGGGLLVYRDELSGFLAKLDITESSQHQSDRAFYLESWAGTSSYQEDRIERGSNYISHLCLSLFGGIQPNVLAGLLLQAKHSFRNDGLLQRFQVAVFPDPVPWKFRDEYPNEEARDDVLALFESLAKFNPRDWGATYGDRNRPFARFQFAPEAQKIFIQWHKKLHSEKLPQEENEFVRQHLAKYDKLFCSIALIMHLVECAKTQKYGPISQDCAELAWNWCEHLEGHMRRIYALTKKKELDAPLALAVKLLEGQLPSQFTARMVERKKWKNLSDRRTMELALTRLEEKHWIASANTIDKVGRPTTFFYINPNIYEMFKIGQREG